MIGPGIQPAGHMSRVVPMADLSGRGRVEANGALLAMSRLPFTDLSVALDHRLPGQVAGKRALLTLAGIDPA